MSRIDEALKRASHGATRDPEIAAPVDSLTDIAGGALPNYPAEAGVFQVHSGPAEPLSRHTTAVLPRQKRDQWAANSPGFAGKLVVSEGVAPFALEQYRRLAGAIHELHVERGLKTLMVTSAVPHEGKTLTVSNLALTLSESYRRRVLLIDADLRRPTIHQLFRIGNERGLGEVLRSPAGEIPFREASEHLTVLPAGQVDQPMEGLTSEAMRALVERCAETFDFVLLDAPPVAMMPDARLLANLTRAVLFVIAARSTPHPIVARALSEFDAESVIGTVLNRMSEDDIPATDYYKEYYYPTARSRG
jgi:capsular exopolysaccharide synthesis family protein